MAQDELEPLTPTLLAPAIVEAAEHARIGVAVSSGAGSRRSWEYVSAYVAALLECSPGELSATPASEIFPERVREGIEVWRDCRMAGEGAPAVCETELCAASGERIPVRITASAALAEERRLLVEFIIDLRDHLQRARLLSKSEQRFKELIEVAPEAVAIGTPSGFSYVNPAAVRLLGYDSPEELHALTPIEHVHPDDRRLIDEAALDRPLTLRIKRRDRRWVEVELIALPIEWDGKPSLLAIGRDLGERRQLQAQLVQADRLAAIGTLAAGVAHEINNPLAYVLLNLEYLLRELPKLPGDPERLPRLLERLGEARHGAQRVSSIVSDLRAFSREDADERRPVDLTLVLSSAAKVAEPKIAQRGRVIENYQEVPLVLANAARLEQVFLNLLVNAGQALSADGGGEVRIKLYSAADRVVVEITDNGAGIAPELIDRVFDPFFSTKPIGTGTGLGLPICHSIVTSLGGEIGVESEVDRGTTFRVSLPSLVEAERLSTPTPISSERSQSPRLRVLVVDDELPVAAMLGRVLSDQHDVAHTTTARQALEMYLEKPFDVIVCDLLMPGMSGMDLHHELAQKRPGAEQRLVFMTGGAFTPRAAEFLARVDNPRLEKPFDVSRLRRLLREIVSQRAAEVR